MAKWPWLVAGAFIAAPIAVALTQKRKKGLGAHLPTDTDPDAPTMQQMPPAEMPTARGASDQSYYPKPKEDEDDCLILGRNHPLYDFGEYRVCLTTNQKRKLFRGKVGKKLGCGVFACAYGAGPGKVVKFTRDSEDVAGLLEAQKSGVVPKIYDTFKIKDGGHALGTDEETPVYALVVERLKTIPLNERKDLDYNDMPTAIGLVETINEGRASNLDEACAEQECSTLARETAQAALALKAIGIDWNDIHSGNIGFDRKGKVKVLDLGLTTTKLKKEPKILAGARRRLPKLRSA